MFHARIVWNFFKLKVKCKCNWGHHNTEMSLVFIPEIGIEIGFLLLVLSLSFFLSLFHFLFDTHGIGQLSVCDFMQRLILSFSRGILRRAIEFIMTWTSISSCEKWMWNWQAPSMKVLHLAMKFPSHYLSSSLTILHFLLFLFPSHCLKSFSVCLQRASGIILTNSETSFSAITDRHIAIFCFSAIHIAILSDIKTISPYDLKNHSRMIGVNL